MGTGQKPRLSLPPELGDIDDGWGDDEGPTIARPSKVPTKPIREPVPMPDELPLAPPPIDLKTFDEDDDIQDRVTSVPEIPLDAYAAAMMRKIYASNFPG